MRSCDFLSSPSDWNWSANDTDFCDDGGKGLTRFIYGMSTQTRHRKMQAGYTRKPGTSVFFGQRS
jgi:hypothetical protein